MSWSTCAKVGEATGAKAVLRLRGAADLERCVASDATLLPPDPPAVALPLQPTRIGEPTA